MKRYDCSKVLDFKHEKERMCEMKDVCDNCCLGHVKRLGKTIYELRCDCFSDITEDEIAALQKWSDEHPEKTRAEAFFEMFPTFRVANNNRPLVCWSVVSGLNIDCVGVKCKDCWNEPYNGEFEEAKKDES